MPVYRIFVMGMGNAKVQSAATESSNQWPLLEQTARPAPNRVEVSLLKNNLDQFSSASNGAQQPASANNTQTQQQ